MSRLPVSSSTFNLSSPRVSVDATSSRSSTRSNAAARRTALHEFYALNHDRYTAGVPPSEIDRPNFQVDDWVDKFVRQHGPKAVLEKENKLLHEIRTLDGEGKALVYDNYSKLISATETIQSMRGNMDPLKPTTEALEPAVAHIAEVSTTLIATLSERRRQNAVGDSVSTLSADDKKELLDTIVRSPYWLRELKSKGEDDKANAAWQNLSIVLDKLKLVKGIDKIRESCLAAMEGREPSENV
ncbi:Vps51/Vps67-domain-containing protein [Lipomyces japonicus]|uniref:Vps51/Vps67-domain-containing protein n=1 Tax=Lipomyces japonicus TaxID=56871 RepID=UPI0034CFD66E